VAKEGWRESLEQPARRLLERSPFPVAVQDEDGVLVWVNETFVSAFDVPRESVLGRSGVSRLPESNRAVYLEWSRGWREGKAAWGRLTIPLRRGVARPHWVLSQPLIDGWGRPTGAGVLVMIDEEVLSESIADALRKAGQTLRDVLAALERDVVRLGGASVDAGAFDGLRGTVPELATLTDREWSVARRLACGETAATIADTLGLSVSTVRNHLRAVYRKSGAASRGELVDRLRAWREAATGGA